MTPRSCAYCSRWSRSGPSPTSSRYASTPPSTRRWSAFNTSSVRLTAVMRPTQPDDECVRSGRRRAGASSPRGRRRARRWRSSSWIPRRITENFSTPARHAASRGRLAHLGAHGNEYGRDASEPALERPEAERRERVEIPAEHVTVERVDDDRRPRAPREQRRDPADRACLRRVRVEDRRPLRESGARAGTSLECRAAVRPPGAGHRASRRSSPRARARRVRHRSSRRASASRRRASSRSRGRRGRRSGRRRGEQGRRRSVTRLRAGPSVGAGTPLDFVRPQSLRARHAAWYPRMRSDLARSATSPGCLRGAVEVLLHDGLAEDRADRVGQRVHVAGAPVATFRTSPATFGAEAARRLPSTTLPTYVKSRDWFPSP